MVARSCDSTLVCLAQVGVYLNGITQPKLKNGQDIIVKLADERKDTVTPIDWAGQLAEAGIESIDLEMFRALPTRESIEGLYGPGPHILGLERCKAFRDSRPPEEAMIAIAGLFNTNTNHVYDLLQRNCNVPAGWDPVSLENHGVRWQGE